MNEGEGKKQQTPQVGQPETSKKRTFTKLIV